MPGILTCLLVQCHCVAYIYTCAVCACIHVCVYVTQHDKPGVCA